LKNFFTKISIMKKNGTHLLTFLFLLSLSWLQAQSNQYLHFDRIDDYVEVPNGSGYIAGSTEITMAGWFYTDELAYGQGMMSIRGGGSGDGEMYVIQLNNGTLECRLITTAGFHEVVAPAFSIVPETWQHLAWVYDGSSVTMYINGVSVGSTPASGTITSTNKPFTFGKCLLGGFNFVAGGRQDEVTLWSKALTPTEIQSMMGEELVGNEPGLELYYKFNQGVPGGDNTSILELESETGNGDRNGNLLNFAMMGETSNFGGVLDVSFQAITFPQIPNKLITDPDFQLLATASSSLPVSYEVVSGPVTLNGDMVSLNGTPGEVTIKASQAGNGTYDAADDLFNSFQVIDPSLNVPSIDVRSPLAGDVFVPELKPIQLAAISNIAYPELFSVTGVKFEIDGDEIPAKDWGNEHYTAWWTPPAFGSYSMKVIATNNFGASATETVSINITDQTTDQTVTAVNQVWADVNNGVVEVEAELPSYLGAFDNIAGHLTIGCPNGGCDPWDRISGLEVKGHNGEWYEIIRYITPYGVACSSDIDLTDFMSALQGKIRFRVYLGTLGNGFLYSLDLDYTTGIPDHPYSTISEIWKETYNFGNPADLQPVPDVNFEFPENAEAAKMKLVSTGHGWGDNNTGNAAEFHDDTHHIWIDNVQTFEQHNWQGCNPNPDGCSPQNGTWFYDRAGWCPGSIAQWFDYDMSSYINQQTIEVGYVFDEDYTDLCNADNPNCVSGITCPNCNDGFNPHLIVATYIITTGDEPLDGGGTIGYEDIINEHLAFKVFPNPTSGMLYIEMDEATDKMNIQVYNNLGQLMRSFVKDFSTTQNSIDISGLPIGMYTIEVMTDKGTGVERVVLE
jgi:concanavalin A-like lectin/glucanase superfamily protein/peptide-N-glycosidase F-like protein/type IX secretion system substrate protein